MAIENSVNTIYHYCSVETFMNIIKYATIRMSNITKSNDSLEVLYVVPYIKKAALQVIRKYNKRLSLDYKLSEEVVENALERLFVDISITFFVACFSEEKDLLSQWRGYANNASGVSIGFNVSDLKKLQNRRHSSYKISSVVYTTDEIIADIEHVATKHIDVSWKDNDDLANVCLMENALNKLMSTMLYYSVFYKNPAFAEEREWRLVYNPFGKIRRVGSYSLYCDRMIETFNEIKLSNGFIQQPLSFLYDQNTIKSYIDLNFSCLKKTIIKEIVIGPKAKVNDLDLRLFLLKNGYDPSHIIIRDSISSYR